MADLTKKKYTVKTKGYELAQLKEFKKKDGSIGQTFECSFKQTDGTILILNFVPDVKKQEGKKPAIFVNYVVLGKED